MKSKISILFIQPGYAHYRKDFFELLHKNYCVRFVFLREKSTYSSQNMINPEWHTVSLRKEKNRFWKIDLLKQIIKTKPSVIITSNNGSPQSIIAGVISIIFQIPLILWSEAWIYPPYDNTKPFWKKWLKRLKSKFTSVCASTVIVSGQKSETYNRSILSNKKPIYRAYQSTKDISKQGSIKQECKPKTNQKINILYFSRIIKLKGLDYLIRAFSTISSNKTNTHLTIVGDGDFREYCENLVKELKLENVEFFGNIPNEKAWHYYSNSDIFVLPNSGIGGKDGWGLVINEAASMSLPIITTDAVGAAGDLVKNNVNGFVVPAGNISALKHALNVLIINKDKRIKMGENSRKIFEELNSYDQMFQVFEEAINYALSRSQ